MIRRLALLLILAAPGVAQAQEIERNFAGSAQLDYLAVPSTIRARGLTFDGFTTELAVKLAVDFTDHFSANVKICYGCHGFETNMAYVDLRVADQLNFRVGRIVPSFGDFPLRHDPANHRANSKPLPYDMGRMLRRTELNMSIMPAPYVDNGVEVNGTQWFGDDAQLDYAIWGVSGFKGGADALDFDFAQSRSGSLYYVDNNSEPAVGGRVAFTTNFTDYLNATVGVSGNYGHYDPNAELSYLILGADLFFGMFEAGLHGPLAFHTGKIEKTFEHVEAEHAVSDFGVKLQGEDVASEILSRSDRIISGASHGFEAFGQSGDGVEMAGVDGGGAEGQVLE